MRDNDTFERKTIKKELDEKMVYLNDTNYMKFAKKEALKDIMVNCKVESTKVVNLTSQD